MKFFDIFSRTPKNTESVVLIDIGTSSVAGAYVHYAEGELPTFLYTESEPIKAHKGEPEEGAMLRALKTLGETLIREGAPILARTTGSGTAQKIIVSIDAPWQETTVHTEHFEENEPFIFTENMVSKRLKETHKELEEKKMLVDESIIGTILNGYGTQEPYGKKANHASVIVLTSLIESGIATNIVSTLEHLFHRTSVLPIAGNSLRYQAMREVFPHERDALILDATNEELSSISLVRRGLIVSLIQAKVRSGADAWATTITNELAELSNQFPLPRTIFLLARESDINSLQKALDTVNFGALWLSDNPPKIVPVLKTHMSTSVRQSTEQPVDVVLLLMALFYAHAKERKEKF